jgi:hypothetical protein
LLRPKERGQSNMQMMGVKLVSKISAKSNMFVIIYGSVKSVKISGFIDISCNEFTGD